MRRLVASEGTEEKADVPEIVRSRATRTTRERMEPTDGAIVLLSSFAFTVMVE